ncbi:adult-specific rigid cuticular protein 15.5-like [Procambarus clarkii]|uniref:adult-specific rigid cuticular protein 15.5-like n=1 Tax=Procambarus clarkii TaxID=6728 RepID=UPI001E675A63|nr:adult-specific rigid cuticular protein 15.5-like [Procambarus clarkii]
MNALRVVYVVVAVAVCGTEAGTLGSHGTLSHNLHSNVGAHKVPVAAVSVSHHVPAATISHSKTVFSAPVAPIKSQYHTQDKNGQYSFGYNAGDSSRDESRDAYGNVRGSFSYIDSYGKVQKQDYIADAYGFRVAGTNLPVHITDVPPYRHKRSYATFPASTGPLGSLSHAGPLVHTSPVQGYSGVHGNGGPGGFSYSFRSVPSVIPYNSYEVPTHGGYH